MPYYPSPPSPHLPVSVDATINAGILARTLERVPPDATVLALPMQSVGLSVEHVRFRSNWLAHENARQMLTPSGPIGFGWETQDMHQAGALGDAHAANAELGAAIIDYQATRLATLVQEVRRFDLDSWMRAGPNEDRGMAR